MTAVADFLPTEQKHSGQACRLFVRKLGSKFLPSNAARTRLNSKGERRSHQTFRRRRNLPARERRQSSQMGMNKSFDFRFSR